MLLRIFILLLLCTQSAASIETQIAITPANQLEQAIRKGQIETVRTYIEKGVNINQPFEQGITPLHVAVINNQEAIAELLIQSGALIQVADHNTGATPMHLAAVYGRPNLMKLLLNKGADHNCAMKFGLTPFLLAAQFGHPQVMQLLIDTKRVNLNQTDEEGFTAMHYAAQNGNEVITRLLLNTKGTNANLPDRNNETPAQVASARNHPGIVQLLSTQQPEP
jgi:ankyrin repeat protein